jgi:hypothetical protein
MRVMVLSLWMSSGRTMPGDDQFADFQFEPTRPLGSAAPNWHRLLGDICRDPERSAV